MFLQGVLRVPIFALSKTETMTAQTKTTLTKQQKEFARLYYVQGLTQDELADRVGVSRATISKWVKEGRWDEYRAANNITRPEIVNKNLLLISRLLDKLNTEDVALTDVGKIVDQISKLAAAIERIDKKANVVDAIEVFTSLNNWLIKRMEWDKEITPELLRTFRHYQDLYINEMVDKKGKD